MQVQKMHPEARLKSSSNKTSVCDNNSKSDVESSNSVLTDFSINMKTGNLLAKEKRTALGAKEVDVDETNPNSSAAHEAYDFTN